jgi:hypothetical protein
LEDVFEAIGVPCASDARIRDDEDSRGAEFARELSNPLDRVDAEYQSSSRRMIECCESDRAPMRMGYRAGEKYGLFPGAGLAGHAFGSRRES